MQIADNAVVTFHYILTNDQGELIEFLEGKLAPGLHPRAGEHHLGA